MKLRGQVALVTGAASGIGRATALALAQEGADVAINDITVSGPSEELAAQVRTLGHRAQLCQADVADQAAVEAVVRRVAAELGRLDILVTVAAYSDREPFHTAEMAGFRRTLDVTMMGAFYALRAAVNQMIAQGQGGNVVVIGSPHAHIAVLIWTIINTDGVGVGRRGGPRPRIRVRFPGEKLPELRTGHTSREGGA
jgi:glucose 1-dehydrogenase